MKENMKRKKGFTLIELLAVLVLLAILALITIPIVLKLISNARKDSYVRSAENYLDGVKKAVMNDSINSEVEIDTCKVEGDGNLSCSGSGVDGIPLTVDVDGKRPSDGTINFANGSISDVVDLRFGKYYISGDTTKLAATTKASEEGRIDGVYLVGDKVTYKDERYYVIKKSTTDDTYLTLLKMFPLSAEEVNRYGIGTDDINHVNAYTYEYRGTAAERGGYGIVAWYSDENCRYKGWDCDGYGCGDKTVLTSCKTNYADSDIKHIVDNWAKNALNYDDLESVDGYRARLLSDKDALQNLKFSSEASLYYSTAVYYMTNKTPKWVRGNDYYYWLMDADEDTKASVHIFGYSDIYAQKVYESNRWNGGAVRPVINLKKSALSQ